jgi:osmotically-inducible protein OsmY
MHHHRFVPLTLTLALSIFAPIGIGACATNRTLGERSDDNQTKQRVAQRLNQDPQIRGQTIDVDVRDGVVTLRGQADDRSAVDQAVRIAQGTYGVSRVVNQMQVGPMAGQGMQGMQAQGSEYAVDEDLGIRASVGTELLADPDVRRVNIDIDVIDGVVYLSGAVEDSESKRTAERIARNIDGVVRVENQLMVDGGERGRESDVMGQPPETPPGLSTDPGQQRPDAPQGQPGQPLPEDQGGQPGQQPPPGQQPSPGQQDDPEQQSPPGQQTEPGRRLQPDASAPFGQPPAGR